MVKLRLVPITEQLPKMIIILSAGLLHAMVTIELPSLHSNKYLTKLIISMVEHTTLTGGNMHNGKQTLMEQSMTRLKKKLVL